MPPRIPLVACLQKRAFSTSRCLRAIGPESPTWLEVPEPVQPNPERRPTIKGILPVPRDPFGSKNQYAYKATPEYLENATKRRSKSDETGDIIHPRLAWKARMAGVRRRNLREGMHELAQRKLVRTAAREARSSEALKMREERIRAPERADEKFTAPTQPPEIRALLSERGPPKSTRTAKDIEAARRRYEELQQRKSEARQDKLHVLHTLAKDFIVDEDGLDAAIELEFGPDDRPRNFGFDKRGASVWDEGTPMLLREIIEKNRGSQDVEQARLRRLAEELTGGRA